MPAERTISWTILLADQGTIVRAARRAGLLDVLSAIGLVNGDRLLDTPVAVIGST